MTLQEYLSHNNKLEDASEAFLDNLYKLKVQHGDIIRETNRGLYIEACEVCEFSSDELKIYKMALEKFERLLENAEEIIEANKKEALEKKKPKKPTY